MSLVLIANTDFFKKPSGILKICQLILGMIVMSLCAHYSTLKNAEIVYMLRCECFLLIASCTFFTMNFVMIISSLFSVNTESRLRQTLFEPLYHALALILYFSGSVAVLARAVGSSSRTEAFMAAGGIGVITSLLYGVSAYDSYRGYLTE